MTEVKWSVPEGFTGADEPEKLDGSLIGDYVYLRWERYGWQIVKITAEIYKCHSSPLQKFQLPH